MNTANSRRKSALERRLRDLVYWQETLKTTKEEHKPGIAKKVEFIKTETEILKARIK